MFSGKTVLFARICATTGLRVAMKLHPSPTHQHIPQVTSRESTIGGGGAEGTKLIYFSEGTNFK